MVSLVHFLCMERITSAAVRPTRVTIMRLGNPYASFRYNALLYGLAAVALAPFAVFHVLQGNDLVAALTGGSALFCAALGFCVLWSRRVLLANAMLMLIGVMAIGISALMQGAVAMYWAFPLVMVTYQLFALRPALLLNILVLLFLAPIMLSVAPPAHSSRLLVTLALVSAFSYVFARCIRSSHQALEKLAERDPLTGVWNRLRLDDKLAELIERQRRHGTPCTALVLDADHFKRINDNHGHGVGDQILVELAALLRARTRQIDFVFRYGGEEFVLLLTHTTAAQAWTLAEGLRILVAQRTFPTGVRVTVSIGIAQLRDGESARSWLERADAALYNAKQAGRNRVCMASGCVQNRVALSETG